MNENAMQFPPGEFNQFVSDLLESEQFESAPKAMRESIRRELTDTQFHLMTQMDDYLAVVSEIVEETTGTTLEDASEGTRTLVSYLVHFHVEVISKLLCNLVENSTLPPEAHMALREFSRDMIVMSEGAASLRPTE